MVRKKILLLSLIITLFLFATLQFYSGGSFSPDIQQAAVKDGSLPGQEILSFTFGNLVLYLFMTAVVYLFMRSIVKSFEEPKK